MPVDIVKGLYMYFVKFMIPERLKSFDNKKISAEYLQVFNKILNSAICESDHKKEMSVGDFSDPN